MKRDAAGPATSLAMIGPRAADSVLFLGAERPQFAAEVGAVTRLNGRTVVVGDPAHQAGLDRAAENAGALIEFVAAPLDRLPFDPSTFHIVVTADVAEWADEVRLPRLAEAMRVLQPGGRMVVIVGGTGQGLVGRFQRRATLAADEVLNLLIRCGLTATRQLADSNGIKYFEGRKSRD
jgi:SAM-dependent methyltransferase